MTSITKNIPLSDYSSYKIGGIAEFFAEVKNSVEVIDVLKNWKKISENLEDDRKKILVLGGGTNLLFDDSGFAGLVILDKINFIEEEPGRIEIGSGASIEELLTYCTKNNLSGLEWAGGLPGTVGGAIRGNAGAFGGEIKDVLISVTSLDMKTYEIRKRIVDMCEFDYRDSIFKSKNTREIILSSEFSLSLGKKEDIEVAIREKIDYRNEKHPNLLEFPNAGSTFKNIPVEDLPEKVTLEFKDKIKKDPFPILPVVKLIAGAGMTGKRVGDIAVSDKHPNYFVNLGNCKSTDVLNLIAKVKEAVRNKYSVEIEEEITII